MSAETREQLRVLEDELHRLRDIALPKFQVHRERLEEQLAQAQQDTERLDWLEAIETPYQLSKHAGAWTLFEQRSKRPNKHSAARLREAIDAALRAKPEPTGSDQPEDTDGQATK